MKDQVSAALSSSNKRFMFHEAIGASFMVCFVVFGVLVCIENRDLRSELRKVVETNMLKSPDSAGGHYLIDDDDEDTDEESVDDIDYYGIPDWVPSFPAHDPAAKASGSAGQNETLNRVRRASRNASGRRCDGCCRECDCKRGKKKPNANGRRNCKQCCKTCGSDKKCQDKKHKSAKRPNSIFRDRLGHFIGSKNTNVECPYASRSYILKTETGDICAWEYAKWMKSGAKDLYNLQRNGKVRVAEAGMYYLYGQLIVYDSKPTASIGLMIKEGHDVRQLTKCIETAGYLIGEGGKIADKSGSFRSCNMGSVTELQKNAEVYLMVHLPKIKSRKGEKVIPVTTFHNATTAFFGIIKYT